MAQQLAKRLLNTPTLTRGTVRLLTVPAGATETKEERVERYKSPYLTFNKSDPLNLDSLLTEEEKMIRCYF